MCQCPAAGFYSGCQQLFGGDVIMDSCWGNAWSCTCGVLGMRSLAGVCCSATCISYANASARLLCLRAADTIQGVTASCCQPHCNVTPTSGFVSKNMSPFGECTKHILAPLPPTKCRHLGAVLYGCPLAVTSSNWFCRSVSLLAAHSPAVCCHRSVMKQRRAA